MIKYFDFLNKNVENKFIKLAFLHLFVFALSLSILGCRGLAFNSYNMFNKHTVFDSKNIVIPDILESNQCQDISMYDFLQGEDRLSLEKKYPFIFKAFRLAILELNESFYINEMDFKQYKLSEIIADLKKTDSKILKKMIFLLSKDNLIENKGNIKDFFNSFFKIITSKYIDYQVDNVKTNVETRYYYITDIFDSTKCNEYKELTQKFPQCCAEFMNGIYKNWGNDFISDFIGELSSIKDFESAFEDIVALPGYNKNFFEELINILNKYIFKTLKIDKNKIGNNDNYNNNKSKYDNNPNLFFSNPYVNDTDDTSEYYGDDYKEFNDGEMRAPLLSNLNINRNLTEDEQVRLALEMSLETFKNDNTQLKNIQIQQMQSGNNQNPDVENIMDRVISEDEQLRLALELSMLDNAESEQTKDNPLSDTAVKNFIESIISEEKLTTQQEDELRNLIYNNHLDFLYTKNRKEFFSTKQLELINRQAGNLCGMKKIKYNNNAINIDFLVNNYININFEDIKTYLLNLVSPLNLPNAEEIHQIKIFLDIFKEYRLMNICEFEDLLLKKLLNINKDFAKLIIHNLKQKDFGNMVSISADKYCLELAIIELIFIYCGIRTDFDKFSIFLYPKINQIIKDYKYIENTYFLELLSKKLCNLTISDVVKLTFKRF